MTEHVRRYTVSLVRNLLSQFGPSKRNAVLADLDRIATQQQQSSEEALYAELGAPKTVAGTLLHDDWTKNKQHTYYWYSIVTSFALLLGVALCLLVLKNTYQTGRASFFTFCFLLLSLLPVTLWFFTDRGILSHPIFVQKGEGKHFLLCQVILLIFGGVLQCFVSFGANAILQAGFPFYDTVYPLQIGVTLLTLCGMAYFLYLYIHKASALALGLFSQTVGILLSILLICFQWNGMTGPASGFPQFLIFPFYGALLLTFVYTVLICFVRKHMPRREQN